jgi:hypothetical protein
MNMFHNIHCKESSPKSMHLCPHDLTGHNNALIAIKNSLAARYPMPDVSDDRSPEGEREISLCDGRGRGVMRWEHALNPALELLFTAESAFNTWTCWLNAIWNPGTLWVF